MAKQKVEHWVSNIQNGLKFSSLMCISDKAGIAVVQNLLIDFWETLQAAIKSGDFLPTGLSHDYACNFCGFGKSGKCPYYKLKS